MIAEPRNYDSALKLMVELRKNNIECHETEGGVRIYPSNVQSAQSICDQLGVYHHDSDTSFSEEFRKCWRTK